MQFYTEDGRLTGTQEFPFDEIDSHLCPTQFAINIRTQDNIDLTCQCQRAVWEWVYSAPCEDLDGFMCRCIVCVWIFYPPFREYTMTRIAARFGKRKQSIGRPFADFKKRFPQLTKHLLHTRHNHD